MILLQLIYSGIALGMIYAVIAFGYQLTFATSGTLNFGQGEALMLGALVGLTLVGLGVNYWVMIPIVCIFGFAQGALVERVGVRPAIKTRSEFGWIMATIALGIIFKNVAENLWGRDDLRFPSPLPEAPIQVLGANVLPMELLVVFGALGMMMGINTGMVITFSYALSSLTAAFAGVLVAPLTLTGATMGAVLGLKAFAVAIIGGLSSGMGVVVGGLILGIAETTTGFYLSTGYKDVPGLVLLLLVLTFKPAGLFGKTAIKKV